MLRLPELYWIRFDLENWISLWSGHVEGYVYRIQRDALRTERRLLNLETYVLMPTLREQFDGYDAEGQPRSDTDGTEWMPGEGWVN